MFELIIQPVEMSPDEQMILLIIYHVIFKIF